MRFARIRGLCECAISSAEKPRPHGPRGSRGRRCGSRLPPRCRRFPSRHSDPACAGSRHASSGRNPRPFRRTSQRRTSRTLVDLVGDGLERIVHFAVFANAVDVVEGRQQGGQHVDDAVLTEAFLLLLRAVAEVDELRAFALQRLQIFGGFLLGLARGVSVSSALPSAASALSAPSAAAESPFSCDCAAAG